MMIPALRYACAKFCAANLPNPAANTYLEKN